MRLFIVLLVSLFISACGGYKPAPVYADEVFENPVIVKVKLDPEDPSAGVYLQDTISQLAVSRLNLTVTKNAHEAKSYIVVNSYAINTSPVNYDENGNVIRYSVNAAIKFAVKDKMGFWSRNIVTNEYVNVAAQTALGSAQKEKAAKVAINKGLDTFILAVIERSKKFKEQQKEAKEKEEISSKSQESSDNESQESIENKSNQAALDVATDENATSDVIPSKEEKIFESKELNDPLTQLSE